MFEAQYVVILCLVITIQCRMEGYIVGGELANIKKFPFCAFVTVTCKDPRSTWFCGSSILNQNILLTAAHCLNDCQRPLKISISVGNSYKNRGHLTTGRFYIYHERFNPVTMDDDIGLVKMKTRVPFSTKASRVALMRNPPQVDDAEIAGWGVIDEDRNTMIQQLKQVKQTVWTRYNCERMYGRIKAGKLCASLSKAEYPSVGDSGSALVVEGYIQIGLVSYKMPTIASNLVVYTNVSYYYYWISRMTKLLYCRDK